MRTEATKDRAGARLHQHYQLWFVGDGATTEFRLTKTYGRFDDVMVFVNGSVKRPDVPGTAYDYRLRGLTSGYSGEKNAVSLNVAPALNQNILVTVVST